MGYMGPGKKYHEGIFVYSEDTPKNDLVVCNEGMFFSRLGLNLEGVFGGGGGGVEASPMVFS